MAKPIKETPILKGKDAQRFLKEQSAPKDSHANKKERERILENYNRFKSAENTSRHIPA